MSKETDVENYVNGLGRQGFSRQGLEVLVRRKFSEVKLSYCISYRMNVNKNINRPYCKLRQSS